MKIKKIILITLGCISLGVGCVGIALPILPTTPFFLVATFLLYDQRRAPAHRFVGPKTLQKAS